MKTTFRSFHLLLKILTIGLIVLLTSCENEYIEPYETYILPAGKHAGFKVTQSLQSTSINFTTIFDPSAKYQTVNPENQHDINKLMGFSDCNSYHHYNSARFGWRWLENQLEIHAYAYVNGERKSELIGTVEVDRPYDYRLSLTDHSYYFYLEGSDPVEIEREPICKRGLYYMLYPYFGGDETAPHDILIKIKMHY